MSTRTVVAAVAAAVVTFGCAQLPTTPRDAAWKQCDTSQPGAHCDVKITPNAQGPYFCEAGGFAVDPDYLQFTGGKPAVVTWRLDEPYRFCDGDDAFLKLGWETGTKQIFETFRSEKEDGARAGHGKIAACTPVRNWVWHNDPGTAGNVYRYGIRFRTPGGASCTIDPFFKNG